MGLIITILTYLGWIFGLLVSFGVLETIQAPQWIWNFWIISVVLTTIGLGIRLVGDI